MPPPSFTLIAAPPSKPCCWRNLPIQLEYLNTPATAGHALLPARVSRAAMSFDELLAMVDRLEQETGKFDFAGVHAANVEAFFYRNDGAAAERVAECSASA